MFITQVPSPPRERLHHPRLHQEAGRPVHLGMADPICKALPQQGGAPLGELLWQAGAHLHGRGQWRAWERLNLYLLVLPCLNDYVINIHVFLSFQIDEVLNDVQIKSENCIVLKTKDGKIVLTNSVS